MSAPRVAIHDEIAPAPGYRCLLDVQPDFWAPRELYGPVLAPTCSSWLVNPLIHYTHAGRPQGTLAFAQAVTREEPMVWVSDPVSAIVAPFVLSPALASFVSALEPGASLPAGSLDVTTAALMDCAGLIYDPNALKERRARWRTSYSQARRQFAHGYAQLGALLHPFTLGAARVYFRRLVRQNRARMGDHQSPLRWVAHNEPVARFFHHQLTPLVSTIAGVDLKPSYVYFASYEGGAQLPPHTDREQCEISLSMLIDYSPQPAAASPWPLLLDTPQGVVSIHQRLGDALVYRGREIPHYRPALEAHHTSTHLFFHYVLSDFAGPLF